MKEAPHIEQPEAQEDKKTPPQKTDNLWYGKEKFDPEKHKAALRKARSGSAGVEVNEKEERRRLEAELANVDTVDKRTLRPEELRTLDSSVRLNEQDRKAPKKDQEAKERQAFVQIMKTLQEKNKLPVQTEQQTYVFEFKGLTKDGKDVKPQEVEKMLEHVDQGGDVPPGIEFHFSVPFKKGNEQNEVLNIDYRTSLHQVMRQGLEATLSSLLSLSYAAIATYDAHKQKGGSESAAAEKTEAGKGGPPESFQSAALDDLRKQLQQRNVQTSYIRTGQWNAVEVSLPERQKQLAIVFDGEVFRVTEKHQDATIELPVRTPNEILEYIEKETK